MRKKVFNVVWFLSFFLNIYAQKAPMKYGKVDQADLDMKVYALDSSASAVVLCNYGYFSERDFKFLHMMRIKVLKEEGKSNGNFVVPVSEKAIVTGQVVNMENGVAVVTKLSKESIFIEKVSKDQYRARVAFPNVKVGSVIDVKYSYEGLPNYWNFQQPVPVKWSELTLEEHRYVSYRKIQIGYTPFFIATSDRWVTKDVPAFKSEPYINNNQNYISRFEIELSSIQIPGFLYKDYATTWDAVATALSKESKFGMELSDIQLHLNSITRQIKEETSIPEERLNKAFQEIKKIKWNNSSSIFVSGNGLGTSFNKKIGNVADINLNLVLLLRKLDIDANPIVLSTRSNGIIPPHSVSFNKFNYVVVQAKIGEKTIFLDATEEYLPIGLLPKRTLNGRGLVIIKDKHEWVDLTPLNKDKITHSLDLQLAPNGILKGRWDIMRKEYAAFDQRKKYKSFNSQEDYLKSIENKNTGISIDEYNIANLDSITKPLVESFNIVLKNKVTKVDNQLFVNPILFDKWTENPFKEAERVFPVDFTNGIENVYKINLEIPEGYTVGQLPKNIKMTLPENAANFQMQANTIENKVQLIFKMSINKPIFYITEYLDLKSYFDELVKKQAEMIIINKI